MRIKTLILITCLFFTVMVGYELYGGYAHFRTNMYIKAKDTADVFVAFRMWNTQIGSVYIPANSVLREKIPLHNTEIITAGKTKLIKLSSSYMTHLVSNSLVKTDGISVRMISQNAMSPSGSPIGWEINGLKNTIKTGKEFYKIDFISLDNVMFRYIRPIRATDKCISCHNKDGFRNGELGGGLSVTFPITTEHNKDLTITMLKIFAYMVSSILVILLITSSRKKLITAWEDKLHTILKLEKEIQLREMSEKALVSQTRSSSISEILSLVAHHWRQPLNNVGLLVQSMEGEDNIDEVKKSGIAAMQIIQDMSETINLFTSTIKTNSTGKLEVKNMVFDTLRLLKPEFENMNIEVHIHCNIGGIEKASYIPKVYDNIYFFCGMGCNECKKVCGHDDIFIEGDEAIFKQVMLIMLKNAYDSVIDKPSDQKRIISLIFSKKGGFGSIAVCDNGAQIPEDIKEKLFDPYFTTKGYEAGRGIGLFTARSLTSNFHNAHIYFDDTDGKCFVFEFKDCG